MNFKRIEINRLDSTNSYAQSLLRDGICDKYVVIWAKEQVQGRGQRENVWWSKKNESLTFTLILSELSIPIFDNFLLTIISSLAINKTLSNLGIESKIKWPNDLFINGKKAGGILIENSIRANSIVSSLIGVGINVNQLEMPDDLYFATSLALETGRQFDLSDILNQIMDSILYYFQQIANRTKLIDLYYFELYAFREKRNYSDVNGAFVGEIIGIENDGRLQVVDENGILKVYFFKEIELIK
jgi:BirA family biotin operon repressor/biotin-[acetyl-CoA-carboxylase] ligase